jgi:signal transduction histidine kinase/CheY-like chemotaxis protein
MNLNALLIWIHQLRNFCTRYTILTRRTLKTKSKHLSFGILPLIIILVIFQVSDGFSGILPLPISKFVYYGLIWSFDIPVVFQVAIIFAVFIFVSGLLKLSLPGFGFRILQSADANGIVYFAAHALGTSNSDTKKKRIHDQGPQAKPATEQGILMISGGNIMFANKAFFAITGYTPLDIFGKDFASLIQPSSLINYTMLGRIPAAEIQHSEGIALITKNCKKIVAYSAASVQKEFDTAGINIFYVKQLDVLQKNESSIDNLFFDSIENVDALHWIWDEKGILYLNNSCRHNLPFALGQILSKPGLMLKSVCKKDRAEIRQALHEYSVSGKFNRDICCISDNGDVRYFRVNITKHVQSGNSLIRNHAIAYDISDEKRSLQLAEAAALEAVKANKNKTAFLANMSHEIRSPLNGIIGFSELLADRNLTDAERERYLTIIQNNGNALITLLSDLIDISKLESGNLEIKKRKFAPSSLMDELRHQFENTPDGKTENVNIVFTKNTSFQDLVIESDPNRLRQVLVNLITNAIKFTSKGRIEIGADFSGNEMLFWVKDSGIGIPYEKQQAVFERFRQVETPDSKPLLGFGLGLAISKALVELLGGHLWVESIPEQGSLFSFTIKTNTANSTMETNHLNVSNSSYPFNFKEHTILIAEDIDFSFLYIEAVLRRSGVRILWAQNGKEAIEHVKINRNIDLVLMDMHMPIMNGYEATRIISEMRPELPIIAQTAFVLPDDVKKCYAAGCSGYLAKPIRKEQLLNTLSEYFEKMDNQELGMPLQRASNG